MQGLSGIVDPQAYLRNLNIDVNPKGRGFSKLTLCTRKRELDLKSKRVGRLVIRGGSDSLEHDMYEYAEKAGVRFEFNTTKTEKDADVIATGRRRDDAVVVGAIFDNSAFDRDRVFVMFDDRFTPKGGYLYALPISGDRVEIINCVTAPYATVARKLLFNAISENKTLGDIVDGNKPAGFFGCTANFDIPRSAVRENRMYVGEAAGFQDASVGTGMRYALESGKMAAEAIVNNSDYDVAWKREFLPSLKASAARRFALSVFGDRILDFVLRDLHDGDYIDVDNTIQGSLGGIAGSALFHAAAARNFFTGRWF